PPLISATLLQPLPCRRTNEFHVARVWRIADRASPCRWLRLRGAGSAVVPSRPRRCASQDSQLARPRAGWKDAPRAPELTPHAAAVLQKVARDSAAHDVPCRPVRATP